MIEENQTYSKPFLCAIALHIIILGFLLFELTFPSASSSGSSQPVIQAVAVSQSVVDKYNQEVQQIQQQKIQQQEEEQQQQIQKQVQKQIAQQKQMQLQKLQAQKLAVQQAQALKAAQEKVQQQKMAQEKQEKAIKQTEMKKALQQQLKADIQKQLASDTPHSDSSPAKQAPSAPIQNTGNPGEIEKYKSLIIQSISQQWIVPQNLPQNISCELDVSVAPGGVVLKVSVIKSSGNPVLDNSAMAAVNKASPLPVPGDTALFNQFREFHLTVKPDGLMVEG